LDSVDGQSVQQRAIQTAGDRRPCREAGLISVHFRRAACVTN
jgi:hypothetical protein